MNRRIALKTAAVLLGSGSLSPATPAKGRLKQSVARWCYKDIALDDLCRAGADMGLSGIDLIGHEDWPTARKYGLVPAMTPGAGTIADGWNRLDNHARLVPEMQEKL